MTDTNDHHPPPSGERQGRAKRFERAGETRTEAAAEQTEERIAKTIARAGIASRRDAEAMIAQGRVTLNGELLSSPAVNVTGSDRITVDGEPLPARERTRLWLFHKPRGLVTTARDPEGRPTVFDNLPDDLPRVVAIGRLDINTEGLLLLTNDGGLAKVIAHPDTGWMRRYKVRAHGDIDQSQLDRLRDGISIDGMDYGPIEATLDRVQGDNAWITMGLREGKNREIKRILEHLGLSVNRLIRVSFGPFQLGDLEPGLVEEIRSKVLKEQLGKTLAEAAGVDFESPVREPIAPFGRAGRERPDADRRETRSRDERPARGERPVRFERPARGEGPARGERFGRDGDRPRRPAPDRGFRAGGGGERPRFDRDGEERRAPRPSRPAPHATAWRDEQAGERPRAKAPRRGEDPRAARAASGERQHERVGAITAGEGRKVVVERLVSERKDETPRARPRREAPSGDERPRRNRPERDFGERAPRPARADRPGRDRTDGERPPRRDFSDGPPRARTGTSFGRGRPERDGGGAERPPRRPRADGPREGREQESRPAGGFRSGRPPGNRAASPGGPGGGGSRGDGPRKGPGGFGKGPRSGGAGRDSRPRGGSPGGRPGGGSGGGSKGSRGPRR